MAELPTAPNKGQPITAAFLKAVVASLVRSIKGGRGINVKAVGQDVLLELATSTPIPDQRPLRLRIKEIFNDYLRCRTWDGTNEGDVDIYVAKPFKLRHVLANYPQLDDFTTVNTQEATVEYDGDDYTWVVTPAYVVNDIIEAKRMAKTGVSVSATELTLEEDNNDARAWGIEE